MDILAVPHSPSTPIPMTPFIGRVSWDCGPFLSFADRLGLLGKVPYDLRHPTAALHIPYTELLYPSAKEETENFFLTWFYFGLVAEVLGLNEGPGRATGVDQEHAEAQYDMVYRDVIMEVDGARYINGAKIFEKLESRLASLMAGEGYMAAQLGHIKSCLYLTCQMLRAIHSEFDESVLLSIAGLGEIVSSAARACYGQLIRRAVASGTEAPPDSDMTSLAWGPKHLHSSKPLMSDMIGFGWCPSEIERVTQLYRGITTMFFLSRLNKGGARRDHSSCTKVLCKAFQIDLATYKLSHAQSGCSCSEYVIDIEEVQRVLRHTKSYPILCFNQFENGHISLTVEEYKAGDEYVALSHVWADGLGNPNANAIQECQVVRLQELITNLQRDMVSSQHASPGSKYRLWIDTLCCPTEQSGKRISLERILDVYRNATHVLVLDSSISSYSSDTSPVEILLRIFGTSSWMRRLWTLQEGALSKSLCFQLSDRAAHDYTLFAQLQQAATTDPRLYQISNDVEAELQRVHNFWGRQENEVCDRESGNFLESSLYETQWALYFRSVTVPSDEPLCLATLLSLDMAPIVAAESHEERMALVWQQLSKLYRGIPPRIIFAEDRPMKQAGFRWAPLSLLGSITNSAIDANSRAVRFHTPNKAASHLGRLTPAGLRVHFQGARIRTRPLALGLPLHPWQGLIQPKETYLYAKQESSGFWFRIFDAELLRLQSMKSFSGDELNEWYRLAGDRLCSALDEGDAALIHDSLSGDNHLTESNNALHTSLLVHIKQSDQEDGGALLVHSFRSVVIDRLSSSEVLVAEAFRTLARQLASEDLTLTFLNAPGRNVEGEEWKAIKGEMKARMKEAAMEYWDESPDFQTAVEETIGPDMREWFWVMIPMLLSHEILLEDLPQDQIWIVD
ncbi:hypothetical protein BGZ61DRAFT_424559 [Ilyonectria robusta]|uniref:uncharacterized protein n=1 Tax=Ilyonectria robusta TaxID=1079257 RepID=UPI001E8D21F6|nr:uncharacterized protein BGZ61DRAFT_424559 [Ilyonectria robusta]KAH8683432.1 hypothetical protein BGZ61DRAFT_424559 [Ilyonectria robusta]